MQINPLNLRFAREGAGLSLDKLADMSGIDRQTIHRIETEAPRNRRTRTAECLARALKITTSQLCGPDLPAAASKSLGQEPDSRSQMNLRIPDWVRNSYSLLALRYGVTPNQVVQIAPFLFLWAAETSLRKRQEALSRFFEAWELFENAVPRHLGPAYADCPETRYEEESIAQGDIFGEYIARQTGLYDPEFGHGGPNPFSETLRELAKEMPADTEFIEWFSDGPRYTIGRSIALDWLGGDECAAGHILDGRVSIHEMPKDIIGGPEIDRADWVNRRGEERKAEIKTANEKFWAENPELKERIEDLLQRSEKREL